MRFSNDRTRMELIHVHELRVQRERERNIRARGRERTADGQTGSPAADVLIDHFRIRGEAARCDRDTALREELLAAIRSNSFDADHALTIVRDQFVRAMLPEENDAAFLSGSDEHLYHLGAAGNALAENRVNTPFTGIRGLLHLAEFNADVLFEPVEAGGNIVRIGTGQGGISSPVGGDHHGLIEILGRILDALTDLTLGAPAADIAQSVNGVAVRAIHLLQDSDTLRAGIHSGNSGNQTGSTGAEHDSVISGSRLRGLFVFLLCLSKGESRECRSGESNHAGLQDRTTGELCHLSFSFLLTTFKRSSFPVMLGIIRRSNTYVV
ncbi:unknown [Sutterella sp. CAG:351]|nr:unknown [Sutterella sp. CAG:351]